MGINNRFILQTIIYIVTLVGIILAFVIYTSLYDVPWRMPEGFQFLHFIFTTPIVFGAIGIVNLFINREKQGLIGILNKLHPFLIIVALALPILIDDSLSELTTMTGSVLCIGFIISNTFLYVNDLVEFKTMKA
ncbi:hypothetical protein [Desulfosporosinus youngiae]|uniref:Uncharacterized protein n=1 Tax=Desulfosporosinus youngiae DSM 17734 TaxID=768710 RepID=H5XX72_9FIRM|nr:hypothetical protein [Desulfosporosinus youngiae]EHQ91012.1 hypothetical protein DesyoDRAFT_4042 [Desulfosporosinus youngiae DSM 17734]